MRIIWGMELGKPFDHGYSFFMRMERLFLQFVQREHLVDDNGRILVGLSGGPDSVALLHLLMTVAPRWHLELRAAHLHHGIRAASDDEADFVRDLCAKWQIPLTIGRLNVPEFARREKKGLEESARELRRQFLTQTAQETASDRVALGHHLGDQAETVLHRLIRGAGPTGLSAMRCRQGQVIRPLLAFSRAQILEYLEQRQIAFVKDESNEDCRFTRNRLRHQVVPLLKEINPKIEEQLGRTAALFAEEEEYWRGVTDRLLPQIGQRLAEGWVLALDRLRSLEPAVRRRLLRRFLEDLRATPLGLSWKQFEMLEQLLVSENPHAQANLGDCWAGRDYERLWLLKKALPAFGPFTLTLTVPGRVTIAGVGELEAQVCHHPDKRNAWTVEFDADAAGDVLEVRSFGDGDRFHPFGMEGEKKLKDFFVDAGVSFWLRRRIPLLAVSGTIVWVAGVRRGAQFPVRSDSRRILRVTFRPCEEFSSFEDGGADLFGEKTTF